ncbi:MAG: DUF4411 family protein [Candidatus Kapaibacterium sp.]
MPEHSLFEGTETIYVVDTSALIMLESTFKPDSLVFKAIWEEIEDLISHGYFRTIDFVEEEVNSYEGEQTFLKNWVKKWKRYLVVTTDAESIKASIPIINEEYNTGFFNKQKLADGKEEADPYLIGYCKAHSCILITGESKTKPNKLPKVSEKNGVKCIDIYDFLTERGLKMERKK